MTVVGGEESKGHRMKRDTKKLLIQIVLVLLFSFIIQELLPTIGGGNMGKIYFQFLTRHLLICMVGLIISDMAIFKMRRPKFTAALVAFVAGFVGAIVGGITGVLFAILIDSLFGIYSTPLADIGSFVGPVICMVFSYNFVAQRMKW